MLPVAHVTLRGVHPHPGGVGIVTSFLPPLSVDVLLFVLLHLAVADVRLALRPAEAAVSVERRGGAGLECFVLIGPRGGHHGRSEEKGRPPRSCGLISTSDTGDNAKEPAEHSSGLPAVAATGCPALPSPCQQSCQHVQERQWR